MNSDAGSSTSSRLLRITALLGFLAVALGAFGAHSLKELLARNETTVIWEKAVFYHFVHTLAMLVILQLQPLPRAAWLGFLVGVLVFSGSLYVLAITGIKWLGAITPVGGLAFLFGWGALVWRRRP